MNPVRIAFFFLLSSLAFSQNPLSDFVFGGSGNDLIHGVTTDSAGNIYVVGTTTSADFPVKNAYQPVNPGTQLIFSADAGATWQPLNSPFPAQNAGVSIAVDPKNSRTVYVGSASAFCKSTDGGQTVKCITLPLLNQAQTGVTSIAIDPQNSSIVYLSAGFGGVFKSTDGGQTFVTMNQGLPLQGAILSVVIDPFHPTVLYVWAGAGGYVSKDGAASWTKSTSPWPDGSSVSGPGIAFIFDPVTQGVIYAPAFNGNLGLDKTTDGGATWTPLNLPFQEGFNCCLSPDPKTPGLLYALGPPSNTNSPSLFWKSTDFGATWTSSPAPTGLSGPFAVDPANPSIIIGGALRSTDGGKTWSQIRTSRSIQPLFAPSANDTVYAVAPQTSDAFLAKFLPDGKTMVFSTYFGGMGNELGNAIALDSSGNIWITGNTSSTDLPVTQGAYQGTLKGIVNAYAAKFTNDGKLVAATYLGGSNQDFGMGLAVSPQGNPWIAGHFSSSDFPFQPGGAPPIIPVTRAIAYVAAFDSSGAQLLVSKYLDGTFDNDGNPIAIDASGNATLTGTTTDPNFPITVAPLPRLTTAGNKAFVMKLDSSGAPIYSTAFGGSKAPVLPNVNGFGFGSQPPETDHGVAVTLDTAGNAYILGSTSSTDFPVTALAFQRKIAETCPYPAFSSQTGLIGTISTFVVDDNFVVKLTPDGKNAFYSTLVGGQCYEQPISIAVDSKGRAAIAGQTNSADYPLVVPSMGPQSVMQYLSYFSLLNSDGHLLDYSTYLSAGSTPVIAAGPNNTFVLGGRVGPGAQSVTVSGAFTQPVVPATVNYLAVLTPPASLTVFNVLQVWNAFSLLPGAVAPGEIVTLSLPGQFLDTAADVGLNLLTPLDTNLAGVSVTFDGKPAYIISVFSGKVECIAPVGIAGQHSTAIQVAINGTPSNVLTISVAPTALGLLSLNGMGTGLANARNSDGSLNGPDSPAPKGSEVTIFYTGAGLTSPPEPDGATATDASLPIAPLLLTTGFVHPLAGFVPGLFGYTFVVPADFHRLAVLCLAQKRHIVEPNPHSCCMSSKKDLVT